MSKSQVIKETHLDDDHIDDHVDDEIINCLDLDNPQSFFMFAGAGSGKTRSLVNALSSFRQKHGERIQFLGQRVAIITYTNAACDEIKRRLDYDPLFVVSTIHSFVWELIKSFHHDIKKWLDTHLRAQIEELELKQQKGRSGTKAARDREKEIESKLKRLNRLGAIKKFTYNPNGENHEKDSLNHSEVIQIGADFLKNKVLMQKILINKFPVILVDESQDTNKDLVDALFAVQEQHIGKVCLGLFGDTMQRIYMDGKVDLGINLPEDWAPLKKIMNHRCPERVVTLINRIRSAVDSQVQRPRSDKVGGIVRLFILPSSVDKASIEKRVSERMFKITNDSLWSGDEADYQTLILEHHMAARRLGFLDIFDPLYKIDSFKTGVQDGTLSGLKFFTRLILPIKKANGDKFYLAQILRNDSPLVSKRKPLSTGNDQLVNINKAREAVNQLLSLWEDGKDPLCIEILQCVVKSGLFDFPDCLYPFAYRDYDEADLVEETDDENQRDSSIEEMEAWDTCLNTPFSQIEAYESYITGQANFTTHQGVKGLEFPRVMVIMDDEEARGHSFSYEKLFGAKSKTDSDRKNEQNGKETTIDRTRRLFYVTCSRAKESLAIIAYSTNPEKVRKHVIEEEWFDESEIEMIEHLVETMQS